VANFAALVDSLSISGSRLVDGSPNSSGTVWVFQPGSNTPVDAYSNADATTVITQPIVLTEGGTLNIATFPNGLYVTQPVRLLIQDVDTNIVDDLIYIPATAGDVGVDNESFPDATTLDEVLTQIGTSVGGDGGMFLDSPGATERTIHDKFTEIHISVKDFGAEGDGIAIDTTAIQAAANRVDALGGGVLYFPPGTYLVDQAITLTDADGVTIAGAGSAASVITSTNATANCFTFDTCASLGVRGISITHATTSTGIALSLTDCLSPSFSDVVHEGAAASGFRYGLSLVGCSSVTIIACTLEGESANAASRGILADDTGPINVFGGRLEAVAGHAFEADGTTGTCLFVGVTFATRARFAAGLTGTTFTFVACPSLELSVATATIPSIRLVASAPFASTGSAATGGNITPSLIGGNIITLTASGGGAGTVTVNNPAIFPPSAPGQFWDFILVNTAGGANTWSFGAAYRLNGAVSNNDAQTTMIRFYCDGATIREASFRAVTTT